jgi:DNA-binding XRE family transcriptional regulator
LESTVCLTSCNAISPFSSLATYIDALPCCKSCIINALRKPRGYPKKLNTVGDHIKAKRLDKGLYQKELAKMLGIGTDTLINWELGRNEPPSYQSQKIRYQGDSFFN